MDERTGMERAAFTRWRAWNILDACFLRKDAALPRPCEIDKDGEIDKVNYPTVVSTSGGFLF
jgi:hypothetical protein